MMWLSFLFVGLAFGSAYCGRVLIERWSKALQQKKRTALAVGLPAPGLSAYQFVIAFALFFLTIEFFGLGLVFYFVGLKLW